MKYSFGTKLKQLRKEKKLTQEGLAKAINEKYDTNFSKGMISKWENDREDPRMESLYYIADFFNVSLDEFLELKIKEPSTEYVVGNVNKAIPLYGSIAAGALATVEAVTEKNIQYINLPKIMLGKYASNKNLFALKVNGESMNKVIPNGSYVICKPIDKYEVKDDDIVIFSYDREYSMKRFRLDEENGLLIFSPESSDKRFYDIVIPHDAPNDLKIYAKVIWYAVALD
ncbi:XRE family transcriptional regulator [Bacillus sp. FSL W8-0223]|uniref:XRE family transcriptional regulator n=2 Tax=Bacillus TaxID=1386 RepID=UPI0030FC969B